MSGMKLPFTVASIHFIPNKHSKRYTNIPENDTVGPKLQVHLKIKLNIIKKVNIFCHSFLKVKPIYYIDSLHRVTFFTDYDYGLQIMKTQNLVSQKI